jgi:tRNA dimethylallyltransferase
MSREKIIIIIGPTASGKSELAVRLAKKYNGEIVSADSRQIYQGLNLGTGKVEGRWSSKGALRRFLYKNIRHHCIDIVNPKKQVSAAQFQRLATRAIKDILKRKKLPIICGGTAHWVDAVAYRQKFPQVKPNPQLRAELEKKSTAQLFKQLKKLDPERAKTIDPKNPRRLVRAMEIILTTGRSVPQLKQSSPYDSVWIGLQPDWKTLNKKIEQRLKQWLKNGLLHEIETLHKQGLSWQRIEDFGLDYTFGALYLQDKISYNEMLEKSTTSIKRYAKRQMTWWKRNQEINWIKNERQLPKVLR